MRSFHLLQPALGLPLLYDSPHSGREYPADFGAAAQLGDLRRGEDAYLDLLLEGAERHGVTVLTATVPRCYIDLNRAEDDVDVEMLSDPWPGPLNPSEKSARGLGLIRRLVLPGIPIYQRKLTPAEVQARIENVYRPYWTELRRLRQDLAGTHGTLWHVNWHSMKSMGNAMTPDGEGARRPDFVVGNRDGASAGPELTDLVVGTLRGMGYSVSVNDPYAGGTIVRELGDPTTEIHCLQIEINRGLYLDEVPVTLTSEFESLKTDLAVLTETLASALR